MLPPENFNAQILTPYSASFTWENVSEYHIIQFWQNKNGEGWVYMENLFGHAEDHFTTGLQANTPYCWRIKGEVIEPPGETNFVEDCATTYAELEDPTDLVATAFSDFIELIWKDNAGLEDNYCIERKLHSGSWLADHGSEIATVSKNMEFFRDETVVAGTEYDYRVCARQEPPPYAYSDYSNVITATANILPGKALNLQIPEPELNDEQLRLTWEIPSSGGYVAGYRIEKSLNSVDYSEIAVVDSDVFNYLVKGLSVSTDYWFRVRAYNGVGNGTYSDVATDTTLLQYELTDFEKFIRNPNVEPILIAEINLKMNVSGFTPVGGKTYTYELSIDERGVEIDGVREDGENLIKFEDVGGYQAQKLTDGGLEVWTSSTNLTHWTEFVTALGTVNREAVEIHSGTYSCRLYTSGGGEYCGIYQNITLTPNTLCKLSTWYKRPVAAGSILRLYITTGPTNNYYLQANGTWSTSPYFFNLSTTNVWTKFEKEFVSHPDYSTYRVRFYKDSSSGVSSFYIDDVSVLEWVDNVEATAGSFYWDSSNRKLYVHASDGLDPDTHFVEATFTHLIPNEEFDYSDALCTLPPWLALKNIPGTSQELNEVHEGTFAMSTGQISFINALSAGEYYFDKRFETFSWIGARLSLYLGSKTFDSLSKFKKFFTAIVSDISIEDKMITLSLRDVTEDLNRDLVLNRYSQSSSDPGYSYYPALPDNYDDKEILKGWGYIESVTPVPVDVARKKYNYLDGRSKVVGKVTINGTEKTQDVDYFVDYQRSIITFLSTLTIGEDDVILVSFMGGVNSANEPLQKGAEIFKEIMNVEAGIPTEWLATDWIYETANAETRNLSVFLARDTSYNDITKNLEHSSEAFVLQDGEGRIGLRPLQTVVQSNSKYIWNFQSKGHTAYRTKSNIYWKVRVYYAQNPQTQEWSFKEVQNDEIDWKNNVKKELSIYVYFSAPSDALSLATSILSRLSKPYFKDELPMVLFDVFPGDLINFSRDRFFNEDGLADEVALQVLRVEKSPQSRKTSVKMETV